MDAGVIIACISLIGIVVGPIVTYRFLGGRKKNDSSVASELTGTALNLLNAAKDDAKAARTDSKTAREDADAARQEADQVRTAHRALARQFEDLKARMDHLEQVARAEASWAAIARDALLAQQWPEGLTPKPPILTVIPGA